MTRIATFFRRATEGVAAALLAAMFLAFILQIFSRYVLVQPFGWTLELCLALWVWLVFWGNAFIVRDRDHVTFDLIYLSVRPRTRRIMALISALAVAGALAWSFLPMWDYIDFLKIKRSASLPVRMRSVMMIYMLFLAVVIARMLWRVWTVARNGTGDDPVHPGVVAEE
jgi:C4-dicarboxylate transporter DctQ subunit